MGSHLEEDASSRFVERTWWLGPRLDYSCAGFLSIATGEDPAGAQNPSATRGFMPGLPGLCSLGPNLSPQRAGRR